MFSIIKKERKKIETLVPT